MKPTEKYYKKIYLTLNEQDDSQYTSIGFGRFKKKGEEDKEGSQTFVKDKSGKIIPIEKDKEAEKSDDKGKGEEPKKKEPAQPQKLSGAELKSDAEKQKEKKKPSFWRDLAKAAWDSIPTPAPYKRFNEPNKAAAAFDKFDKQKSQRATDTAKLKDLMPGGDFTRRPLSSVEPIELQKVATKIDDLARMGKEAKAKGEKAPNYNLCQVSIPGTNLYCGGNKGIPRAEMPQFKGTPEPGSPAEKLPKDKNGEVDTEGFFKQMLEKDGVKVSEPTAVPPDRLKSTQSELVGVKVAGMSQVLDAGPEHEAYGAITAPIYVSNDGYVLDGHHRWAAVVAHNAKNPNKPIPMNVRVIDEPIEPLVKRSNKFAEEIGIKPKAADTGAAGGPSPITK
jgi:ParB-like chromosome segregation protein Spo0J